MFHDNWKKKNCHLNYFTEWFWPILWGKVQKLRPIIKLLRQGITKLQKGKKRLNAFDLYSSLLMFSWYIVANGLLYDSTFLLRFFWRVVQQSWGCLYLPFCQRMPSMGYPDAGQETATVRPSMALTGGIWRTCGGPANNNRKSRNALHHYTIASQRRKKPASASSLP